MASVANSSKEDFHQLTPKEAAAYFDKMTREFFGISAEEFLKNRKEYEDSPHFASVEFLLPLVDDSEE
jgi:hypothetical protein